MIAAIVAALVAAAMGRWIVTLVLGLGVAAHAAGWLYLYRQHEDAVRDR